MELTNAFEQILLQLLDAVWLYTPKNEHFLNKNFLIFKRYSEACL